MPPVVIEKPILNAAFREPTRHFKFDDDDGITDEIIDERRPSSYCVPTVKGEAVQLTVEIRGVDAYDPTTGEVRSNSTDDIACWFIDTDDNGQSFFVRHACFTGAGDPYKRLKSALKAEIDEAAWASLYSTSSRSFDPPWSGKIVVKVINNDGDEVMQVYEAGGGE